MVLKVLKGFTAVVCTICLLIIMLFTAVDYCSVQDREFYRQQYIENAVYDFIEIEEDELMRVTDVLLDYLSGKRDSLYVEAEYNGSTSDFFDDIEKAHMVDVQVLYVACIWLRRIAGALFAAGIFALYKMKADVKRILAKSYISVTSAIAAVGGVLAVIISRDFKAAWWMFHEILFTNDLWLLDMSVSKLVNMVPLDFFMNLVARIAVMFAVATALLFVVSLIVVLRNKKTQVVR